MPYKFGYSVYDPQSYNDYGHRESSDGDLVQGEYRVALPDGRTQIVTYYVQGDSGFQAKVRYEETASLPPPPPPHKSPYPEPDYEDRKPVYGPSEPVNLPYRPIRKTTDISEPLYKPPTKDDYDPVSLYKPPRKDNYDPEPLYKPPRRPYIPEPSEPKTFYDFEPSYYDEPRLPSFALPQQQKLAYVTKKRASVPRKRVYVTKKRASVVPKEPKYAPKPVYKPRRPVEYQGLETKPFVYLSHPNYDDRPAGVATAPAIRKPKRAPPPDLPYLDDGYSPELFQGDYGQKMKTDTPHDGVEAKLYTNLRYSDEYSEEVAPAPARPAPVSVKNEQFSEKRTRSRLVKIARHRVQKNQQDDGEFAPRVRASKKYSSNKRVSQNRPASFHSSTKIGSARNYDYTKV